jgi:hypothetical protein
MQSRPCTIRGPPRIQARGTEEAPSPGRPEARADDLIPRKCSPRSCLRFPPDEVRIGSETGSTQHTLDLVGAVHIELDVVDRAIHVPHLMKATPVADPTIDRCSPLVHHTGLLVRREPIRMIKVEQCATSWAHNPAESTKRFQVGLTTPEAEAIPEHDCDIKGPPQVACVPLIERDVSGVRSTFTSGLQRNNARVDRRDSIPTLDEAAGHSPAAAAHIYEPWILLRGCQALDRHDVPSRR